MNRFLRSSLVIVCLAPLSAPIVLAQDAPAAPAAQATRPPRGPRPKPTNIKALPANITGDDLIKIMHQYEGDLGVECEFCHARNPETKRNDFPSDANPVKETARAMIRMTDDLNTKFLTQLSNRKTTDPITCGTCHQGMAHPSVFVPKPKNRGDQPSVGATSPAPTAH
ncbi:photosynthetic reaction center cytochrome c subunit [Edaphobacter aggregans]|uniref:Photosynthetic reaction center cytochrome c subunit n=1 Tax=Edaphobacter aggregans TaxID=570835 RepID=A0A428MIP4_9BACT|nr:c-type cytochrome [Edaphobacter aggregans]RSL16699.1 photosynthetic reaction center cytochrome c subunit [Edaphobacter aggregans]